MRKVILIAALALLAVSASSLMAGETDFGTDVCAKDPSTTFHCKCVGKTAYHKGPTMEIPIGKVLGVVWKQKGSCRSTNCQVLADRDGFYLVVNDGIGQLTKDPRETECR